MFITLSPTVDTSILFALHPSSYYKYFHMMYITRHPLLYYAHNTSLPDVNVSILYS